MELIESPIIYITNGHFLDTYGVVPLSQHPQKEQETRQAHSESSQTTKRQPKGILGKRLRP